MQADIVAFGILYESDVTLFDYANVILLVIWYPRILEY